MLCFLDIAPIYKPCQNYLPDGQQEFTADTIFIVDGSCNLSKDEEAVQQAFVSNLVQLIKDDTKPRVAIIDCQDYPSDDEMLYLSLGNKDYNDYTVRPLPGKDAFRRLFKEIELRRAYRSGNGVPRERCTRIALDEFDRFDPDPYGVSREKKLVYISNCGQSTGDVCRLSNELESTRNRIDVISVNVGIKSGHGLNGNEGDCLVRGDRSRIFTFDHITKRDFEGRGLVTLYAVADEICEKPTGDPTASPTSEPTESPTTSPTNAPTRDPTSAPTYSPSNAPTKNPTQSPTSSPTDSPTKNPTNSPTSAPSASPTYSPSTAPTNTPTFSSCALKDDLDVVFVVDTSCGLTQNECNEQQEFLGNLVQRIKDKWNPRMSYLDCFHYEDDEDDLVFIELTNKTFNDEATTTRKEIDYLFDVVAGRSECIAGSNTPKRACIDRAMEEFELHRDERVRKIISVSNCNEQYPGTGASVCNLKGTLEADKIEVIVINIGDKIEADTFECIGQNGLTYHYPQASKQFFESSEGNLITDSVENDICGPQTRSPTPSPTTAPIKDDILPRTTTDCPRTWWKGNNAATPTPTVASKSNKKNSWWGRRRLRSRKKRRQMIGEFNWWFNDNTPAPTKGWNTQKTTSTTTEDPCSRMWWTSGNEAD